MALLTLYEQRVWSKQEKLGIFKLMYLLKILGTEAGREYGVNEKKSLGTGLFCRAVPLP